MGASLLAKAVGQSTSMAADRLHSRAASLPQGFWVLLESALRPALAHPQAVGGPRAGTAQTSPDSCG
ncbi:hypothetical protein EB795_11900 [Pseudomonas mandelii]|nr:hypothetical protein [Pseudomonas mandelii]